MDKSIQEEFCINAAKYDILKKSKGYEVALQTLLQDIGSDGVILTSKMPHDDGRGLITARLADVNATCAVPGGVSGITTIVGRGDSEADAKYDLLGKLLTPGDQIHSSFPKDKPRLKVGPGYAKKLVTVNQ